MDQKRLDSELKLAKIEHQLRDEHNARIDEKRRQKNIERNKTSYAFTIFVGFSIAAVIALLADWILTAIGLAFVAFFLFTIDNSRVEREKDEDEKKKIRRSSRH